MWTNSKDGAGQKEAGPGWRSFEGARMAGPGGGLTHWSPPPPRPLCRRPRPARTSPSWSFAESIRHLLSARSCSTPGPALLGAQGRAELSDSSEASSPKGETVLPTPSVLGTCQCYCPPVSRTGVRKRPTNLVPLSYTCSGGDPSHCPFCPRWGDPLYG